MLELFEGFFKITDECIDQVFLGHYAYSVKLRLPKIVLLAALFFFMTYAYRLYTNLSYQF